MDDSHLRRILREAGSEGLMDVLVEKLSPTDLQSLMLEVYRRRAGAISPARLLDRYRSDRFVAPSPNDPRVMLDFDRMAFDVAAGSFEPVELSPVAPLGVVSAISTVSQDKAVPTARNTEVVSDSTNMLALECAVRRSRADAPVHLCASHRVVRPQAMSGPGTYPHFRLLGLCSAGRAEAEHGFEVHALARHIRFHLSLFAALRAGGYEIGDIRVTLTEMGEGWIADRLAAAAPEVSFEIDSERTSGRGYYETAAFQIFAKDRKGDEYFLVDGGFTNWTQQLLGNRKERFLISGMGSERVCSLFSAESS